MEIQKKLLRSYISKLPIEIEYLILDFTWKKHREIWSNKIHINKDILYTGREFLETDQLPIEFKTVDIAQNHFNNLSYRHYYIFRRLFSPYNRKKIIYKIGWVMNNKLLEYKLKYERDINKYKYQLKNINLTKEKYNEIKLNILKCIHIILTNNDEKINYNTIESELKKFKLKTFFKKKNRIKYINDYIIEYT